MLHAQLHRAEKLATCRTTLDVLETVSAIVKFVLTLRSTTSACVTPISWSECT